MRYSSSSLAPSEEFSRSSPTYQHLLTGQMFIKSATRDLIPRSSQQPFNHDVQRDSQLHLLTSISRIYFVCSWPQMFRVKLSILSVVIRIVDFPASTSVELTSEVYNRTEITGPGNLGCFRGSRVEQPKAGTAWTVDPLLHELQSIDSDSVAQF